jgi:hypothetical protein
MSLADLASLGSFVSGVGVLISVLLLFFQMRQVNAQIQLTERNQKAAIQQDRYGRVFEVHLARTEPTVADAIAKGLAGVRDMSATEISQFEGYTRARFEISENTFLQHEAGLLSDAAFAAFSNDAMTGLGSPGIRAMWRRAKASHAAGFVAFVDGLIGQASRAAPADPLAQWRADLAAEEAG